LVSEIQPNAGMGGNDRDHDHDHAPCKQTYMENSAAVNNASTSSAFAVYGIFPTYKRRPSVIA
jgi:hypothetical protein